MPPSKTSRPRYQGLAAARGWAPVRDRPQERFSLPVGKRIGSITVIGHLASGRISELYQVWSTDHWCALTGKLTRMRNGASADSGHGLARESEVLSRLEHPNIVRRFGSGITAGRPYLLLEYLAGPSLFDVLESMPRRRLLVPDAIRATMHIGSAVHYLHRSGFLYRDLKPANIILREGVPVLVDFDVVRPMDLSCQPADRLGTAPYMAPEQVRRGPLSPSCDVYGLGALLYELMTGRWPTEEPDEDEDDALWSEDLYYEPHISSGRLALAARADRDIPGPELERLYPQLVRTSIAPRAHNPQIPRNLERIVLRCLDPEPEERFQTVSGLLAALAPFLKGPHRLWPEAAPVERRTDTASR